MTERQAGWWYGWSTGMLASLGAGIFGGEWSAAAGMITGGAMMVVVMWRAWVRS